VLTIRREQEEALASVTLDNMVDRAAKNARANLTSFVSALDDDALAERIHAELEVAHSFGVERPRALYEFVTLALISSGPRFYEAPELAQRMRAAPYIDDFIEQLTTAVIEHGRRLAAGSGA
jgi:hypothetical protein